MSWAFNKIYSFVSMILSVLFQGRCFCPSDQCILIFEGMLGFFFPHVKKGCWLICLNSVYVGVRILKSELLIASHLSQTTPHVLPLMWNQPFL